MTEFLPITDTTEAKERVYDPFLALLLLVLAITALACAPALVTLAWKAAF